MTVVPLLAVAVDRIAGEPPARLHPVVWMGGYCAWAGRPLQHVTGRRRQAAAGAVAVAGGVVLSAAAAALLQRWMRRLPRGVRLPVEAAALSTLLSSRMLEREVVKVGAALGARGRGVAAAREIVAGLVSRDVASLDARQVLEAALESLAENASDAIVAPLWWYAVGGLPAAAAYRFLNTADAMWGYRTARWRWRGAAAARGDDVANWWPARLTALLLAPAVNITRIARTARATDSPNAGWPMGALALHLGVRLAKPGVYVLHPRGRAVDVDDVAPAVRAVRRATAVATLAAALVAPSPRGAK